MVRQRTVALLVAVVAVLSVPGAVAAPPPAPGAPVALSELVPGVPPGPYQPWQLDTPDQALAPKVYTPSAEEDSVEPWDAAAESDALIEYVPLSDAVARHAGVVACSKRTGPYQRQVERWLRLRVDGRQSARDCKAIRVFQVKHGIRPTSGFAGPVTWARMRLLSAAKNPNAAGKCPVRRYRVACVDLTRQLTWVQKGTKVLFGPVPVRSGKAGYRTRTGLHRVYWKHKNHWSTLYNTRMPYSQFFSKGQAFHGIYGNVYSPPGSMGCVNLRVADARTLWGVLHKGDRVYVWGRKSGT
ncbi:L,D-transpeptidase family protein [Streptomyces albicerus]|uniref:L,D-transpeptidase family protein n=1 Tax=Streptomyces albicerus TaxID=2569859 RepID=UPI00124BB40D|nr:L,D-transpeptidase family protein [Streptomyces albicerus]